MKSISCREGKQFYADKSVDLSSLTYVTDYEGLMDYVVIADLVRSPMGFFQQLYASGIKRWNVPKEKDIVECCVAAIDHYFQEETLKAAELCVKYGKPFVTIDCKHDTYLHRHAAINVVSKECTGTDYAGMNPEEIFALLTENTDGLVRHL